MKDVCCNKEDPYWMEQCCQNDTGIVVQTDARTVLRNGEEILVYTHNNNEVEYFDF